MSVIIPSEATMGVVHPLGELLTADFRNGVSLFVRNNVVVFRVFKDGATFYEIEFGENQSEQVAEFFKRGADMIARHGGSGLPPTKTVPPSNGGSARLPHP